MVRRAPGCAVMAKKESRATRSCLAWVRPSMIMGARAQRILIVSIFLVSCLQFLVLGPMGQGRRAVAVLQPFHGGPTGLTTGDRDTADGNVANGTAVADVAGNGTHRGDRAAKDGATRAESAENETEEKIVFCGSCSFNIHYTCNDRLKYLMGRYHLSEQKARASLKEACNIDYINEPYVMLHVGPHKTGTTAIQSFLYHSLKRNETFLQKDKFGIPTFDDLPGVFGGDGPMLNFAHCMLSGFTKDGGQMNTAFCNRLRQTFPPFLERNYNQSRHVLIVAEDLDRVTIDHSRIQYYLKPYRRFRVVATYRRLHDWLPSWYNQIVDLYISQYVQGEARYPSFVEWAEGQYDHFIKVHAIEVVARYRNSGKFESVDIMNMHGEVPLLEDLFCNYLPFANATCQGIRDGAKPTNPNPGRTHEYERLATKARLRGKLKDFHKVIALTVTNRMKRLVVEKGIFKDAESYPKICLNQTFLSCILNIEIEQERKHFPQWFESQGGVEALRKKFDEVKRRKLCSMDDEQLLASGAFDPIFEELNKQS